VTALRIQILEERCSDRARAYCDSEAARRLLERDEKEMRDFEFFSGTFRKNLECQNPGDLRARMDKGQKWVQEHFAPWAENSSVCRNTCVDRAWHNRANSENAAATPPVAEAAVSSTALSDAANPSTGTATVSADAATTPWALALQTYHQALSCASRRQLMPPQPFALRAL